MTSDIVTTASRVVYENRWMRAREDAIAGPTAVPGSMPSSRKPISGSPPSWKRAGFISSPLSRLL